MEFPHFAEEGFVSHAGHLSDEDYGKVLDNMVFACVDVAVTHAGKLLLGKRSRYPYPDWFVMGGRMMPGESFHATAARNLARELGLDIAEDRFSGLVTVSTVWARRAQAPAENGSHSVSATMTVELSAAEAAAIKANDEYVGMQWHSLEDVAAGDYHPYVREVAVNLTKVRK